MVFLFKCLSHSHTFYLHGTHTICLPPLFMYHLLYTLTCVVCFSYMQIKNLKAHGATVKADSVKNEEALMNKIRSLAESSTAQKTLIETLQEGQGALKAKVSHTCTVRIDEMRDGSLVDVLGLSGSPTYRHTYTLSLNDILTRFCVLPSKCCTSHLIWDI